MVAPLYNYIRTDQPDLAGTAVYAFSPRFTLPIFTLPGPGTPTTFKWRVTPMEQLYYNQSQRMDGLIGVVAGQMIMQPLIDQRGISG